VCGDDREIALACASPEDEIGFNQAVRRASRGSGWRPPRRPRLENPSTKLGLPVALVLIGCPIAGLGLVLLWQLIAAVVAARLF
jgi:hypothetical protein